MKKTKVWDLAVRVSHLTLGLLVLGAFLTAEEDDFIPIHTRFGLLLLGVVLFRVVWGFVGPRHARFRDFVRSPGEIVKELRAMLSGQPGRFQGHNPVGGVMVVALLGTLLVVTVTGIITSQGPEWSGPLLLPLSSAHAVKELHQGAAWTLGVLIALHVIGVLVSSLLERQNLVMGMVTGYKRSEGVDLTLSNQSSPVSPSVAHGSRGALDFARVERDELLSMKTRPRSDEQEAVWAAPLPPPAPAGLAKALGFIAAALVGLAAVLLLWRLMPIGSAQAASPLLSTYELAARAESGSFTGFDAARGRVLYFEEHPGRDGPVSCVTCHTPDARRTGRSPVGKVIEPLAPSANPARFTDPAKADKWFDRNCKHVLGRPCTALERGDFLTYLLTL